MKHAMVAVLALGLCACSAPAFNAMTPEQARAMPTADLCQTYGALATVIGQGPVSRAVIRQELTRRGAMTDADWTMVDNNDVGLGSSKCAVLAEYGRPLMVSENPYSEAMAFDGGISVGFKNDRTIVFTSPPK